MDELKGAIFRSHGKTNFFGVAIRYIGSNKVDILDRKIDKNGRISILDVMVDETYRSWLGHLVNTHNSNTKNRK